MDKLPKRKNVRLKDYNYSQNGAYFITICTQNKLNLFGQIVGAIHESPELSSMKLNTNGIIVKSMVENLSNRFTNINIDHYIIMPNHVHMIAVISGERAIRESPLPKRSLISQLIGYLKMNTAKRIHATNKNINVWQRNYHDHVIRNEQEYQQIYEYIEANPLKWTDDYYYNQ